MLSVDDLSLPCPACRSGAPVEAVFDHCTVSWPNQGWLWFECPACGKGSHVELSGTAVSIGELDGGPGPCFVPKATIEVPGLQVARLGWGMKISYKTREWNVRARR